MEILFSQGLIIYKKTIGYLALGWETLSVLRPNKVRNGGAISLKAINFMLWTKTSLALYAFAWSKSEACSLHHITYSRNKTIIKYLKRSNIGLSSLLLLSMKKYTAVSFHPELKVTHCCFLWILKMLYHAICGHILLAWTYCSRS